MKYAVNGNSILIILLVTFISSVLLVPIVKKIAEKYKKTHK